MEQRPKVGVGVLVIKDNKVLLHKRKNAHGDGTWSFPGGHLEFNESLIDCAKRETFEEFGISIKNVTFATVTNDIFQKENKHYLTVYMISEYDSGDVTIKEPNKCEQYGWFEWNNLPQPLFVCLQNLLKQKYDPFS